MQELNVGTLQYIYIFLVIFSYSVFSCSFATVNKKYTPTKTSTVLTFSSYTKCMGSLGIIHDRTPGCHHVSWAYGCRCMDHLTNERSFDLQATYVGDWCAWPIFRHFIYRSLNNQALTDVRSTSAGIKCLYCTPGDQLTETLRHRHYTCVCPSLCI